MFNLIKTLFKTTLFVIIVLVLGNALHWDGRSLSDHVRIQMARLERSDALKDARQWTEKVAQDANEGYLKKIPNPFAGRFSQAPASAPDRKPTEQGKATAAHPTAAMPQEKIPPSERQKLRALIEELNTSSAAPDRR